MRPVVYPKEQTIFYGNGLGVISDALSCKCTEVLNGSYEIELSAPKNGNHVLEISTNSVIKIKTNYEDEPQLLRIYSITVNDEGLVSIKAAHLSYDTAGIPVLPFTAENLADAVAYMNNNQRLKNSTNFVLNADFSAEGDIKVTTPSSFRSLLGGSENTINQVYGGEYHYDNYTINLVEKRGTDKGICFRYGKNIEDFEQEENTEELYSAVLGFWKKSGSGDEEDVIVYGDIIDVDTILPYEKIYLLDTSDKIKNEDESEPTIDQINEYTKQYIADTAIGIPNYSMKISYAEDNNITKVNLGDTVGILFPEYGISAVARVTKVVFDCLAEQNESIELGVVSTGISGTVANVSNKTSSISSGTASSFSGQSSAVQRIIAEMPKVYYKTSSEWEDSASLVSERGAIYIYSDHRSITVDSQTKSVPGIKVGDGSSYLIDLPFIDSVSDS